LFFSEARKLENKIKRQSKNSGFSSATGIPQGRFIIQQLPDRGFEIEEKRSRTSSRVTSKRPAYGDNPAIAMNSINENQPEHNRDDLSGSRAIAKIKEVVAKAQTCFFCTAVSTGESKGTRPMNVRQVDDQGNLWFLSANDSHKNNELAVDASVKLYFQGSPHSDFLQLTGHATISRDQRRLTNSGSQ
jgi:Pyridoxamine 5'-phosphate oxidase like